MSNPAQVAANRRNAAKSTGPGDSSLSRYNALKSGMTGRGLTPMVDVDGFDTLLAQLRAEFEPVGALENFAVERIALGMVRRQRGERLEAGYLAADLRRESETVEPFLGSGPTVMPLAMQTVADLCNLAGRYETATARRLTADVTMLLSLQRERRSLASFRKSGGNG